MSMVLLIRCDWCWLLDTANKPPERLLARDGPGYGDVRKGVRGEEIATPRLDAIGKLPYAGAVAASKPKYESQSAVIGLEYEGSVAAEKSRNNQLNASVQ